jgi:hypothetical protein
MQAQQLDLVTKNPSLLRKMAVSYAVGHALVVRGMGPESPPPLAFAQRLLPVVKEAANALVDTALAGLPASAMPYESVLDMAQALGGVAVEQTMFAVREDQDQGEAQETTSLSEEQRGAILAATEWVVANQILPAAKQTRLLRRVFRAADEQAMNEAAMLGVADGATAAQMYFDAHPGRLSWALNMLETGQAGEFAAVLREPNTAAVDRGRFSRDTEWQAACNVYRNWFYSGVVRLMNERVGRLPR